MRVSFSYMSEFLQQKMTSWLRKLSTSVGHWK